MRCNEAPFEPRWTRSPRKSVLELRFGFQGEQQSLEAIAYELGLSRERVRQVEKRALAELAGKLEGIVRATEDELAQAA